MKISSKARHAIQSMLQLAMQVDNAPLTLSELTSQQGISSSYLEQLFANLREATRRQQCINVTAWGSSEFLGVSWKKCRRKWQVHIKVNGKSRNLGTFACEIEAAKAYDAAAIEHHGEFANLNFPEAS